jgi:hypothetical protein|uniref:Uncharacterized protein n=1 Tax=Mus musculus TaxID=10090 RepID=Q3TZG0_MOUSE|nr:unnamed protein product [Mus musculus]
MHSFFSFVPLVVGYICLHLSICLVRDLNLVSEYKNYMPVTSQIGLAFALCMWKLSVDLCKNSKCISPNLCTYINKPMNLVYYFREFTVCEPGKYEAFGLL